MATAFHFTEPSGHVASVHWSAGTVMPVEVLTCSGTPSASSPCENGTPKVTGCSRHGAVPMGRMTTGALSGLLQENVKFLSWACDKVVRKPNHPLVRGCGST